MTLTIDFGIAAFTALFLLFILIAAGLNPKNFRKPAVLINASFLLLLPFAGPAGCTPHTSSSPAASVIQKPLVENHSQETNGLASSTAESRRLIDASIKRVIDGDTMEVLLGQKTEKIRLLLVDTPETVHPEKPVEPFGPEASAFAKDTLDGQHVQLELDVSERDKYGRVLVYLWHNGDMFNERLLEKGLARVAYVYPPNVKYVDEFREIQKKAQLAGIGIWSIENYAREDGFHDEVAGPDSNGSNANSDLRIVSVTSPVAAGGYATLTAGTAPGAAADITVYYKSGPSKATGLGSKQADAQGRVSWTWKIGNRTTPGIWRIAVASEGKTVETKFEVKK